MPGIHLAGGVEVAVRLLHRRDDDKHAVDIGLKSRVRIGLQEVAGALDRLVYIRVVKGEAAHVIRGIRLRGAHEIVIAPRFLAFAERQRYGHLAAGLQALSPESVGDLDIGERNLSDRIASLRYGGAAGGQGREGGKKQQESFHGE